MKDASAKDQRSGLLHLEFSSSSRANLLASRSMYELLVAGWHSAGSRGPARHQSARPLRPSQLSCRAEDEQYDVPCSMS